MLDILGIRAVLLLHMEVLNLYQSLQVVRLLRQVELLDDPRFADGACLVLSGDWLAGGVLLSSVTVQFVCVVLLCCPQKKAGVDEMSPLLL